MRDSTAAIIVIGDEILSGKTREENAQYLTRELRALGVSLRRIIVVPDVIAEIAATVRDYASRYDWVVTSGGVGPTHDDLTMEGVAQAFDTRVVRNAELERLLRGHYGERLEPRNLRMADVPDGVTLHASNHAAWPVVAFRNVFILPGIPEIFRLKFEAVREQLRSPPFHLKMVHVAADEGAIAAHLDAVVASYPDVAVGSYPRIVEGGWKVKLTLESKDAARVEAAAAELVRRLGAAVESVE